MTLSFKDTLLLITLGIALLYKKTKAQDECSFCEGIDLYWTITGDLQVSEFEFIPQDPPKYSVTSFGTEPDLMTHPIIVNGNANPDDITRYRVGIDLDRRVGNTWEQVGQVFFYYYIPEGWNQDLWECVFDETCSFTEEFDQGATLEPGCYRLNIWWGLCSGSQCLFPVAMLYEELHEYCPTDPPSHQPTEPPVDCIWGDVNNDGIFDDTDSDMIRAHILGIATLPQWAIDIADANCNGYLSTYDIVLLLKQDDQQIECECPDEGPPCLWGDANNDGIFDQADIDLIQAHILGKLVLIPDAAALADANCDGIVTALDIISLLQHWDGTQPIECDCPCKQGEPCLMTAEPVKGTEP